jgi:NAD-dependent SIR2 family protein deacetylase
LPTCGATGNSTPKSFDLTTECPECHYKVPPSEMMRLDSDHMRCPGCKRDVEVPTKASAMTGTAVPTERSAVKKKPLRSPVVCFLDLGVVAALWGNVAQTKANPTKVLINFASPTVQLFENLGKARYSCERTSQHRHIRYRYS